MIALLAAVMLSVPAAALTAPAGDGGAFVSDAAQILSDETLELLDAYDLILEADCGGAHLIVVTVSALYEEPAALAYRLLGEQYGEPKGMLLLVDAGTNTGTLAVGSELQDDFTQDMADEYLKNAYYPAVESGSPDDGVQSIITTLYRWYLVHYNVEGAAGVGQLTDTPDFGLTGMTDDSSSRETPDVSSVNLQQIIIIVIVVLAFWLFVSLLRFRQMRRQGYTDSFWKVFCFGTVFFNNWQRRSGPDD